MLATRLIHITYTPYIYGVQPENQLSKNGLIKKKLKKNKNKNSPKMGWIAIR
jgi:hypothetical protein